MDNEIKDKMKIPISFKEDERWLYEELKSHSSRSGYIKDILKNHIKNEKQINEKQDPNTQKSKPSNVLKGIESLIHMDE